MNAEIGIIGGFLSFVVIALVSVVYEQFRPIRIYPINELTCVHYKSIRSCFDNDKELMNRIKELTKGE